MKKIALQFLAIWRQLGLNQRVSLTLTAAAVIAGVVGLTVWSHRPRMALLYGRLGQKDASEAVAAIQAAGVNYEIGAGGASIYVPADKVYQLRMDLASKGVPGGDSIGFEIFDKSNFGVSDFVQHTNYLRAIQGELARTISGMNGVRSARVMVVMPENKLLLADNKSRPTASVFVDQGAGTLTTEAVNSIRYLVANSVEGMKVDDVAVVDSLGNVLSEKLRDDPSLGGASSQMKLRKGMEDYFAGKVETMLARVVGPGNAVVRVSADVSTETSTTTQEKFDPDGQVVRNQSTTDDTNLTSEGKAAGGGATGVSANVPKPPNADSGGADGPKKSEENRKTQTQTYEISKATTNTTKNPGDIRRLTAAVFVALRTTGTGATAKPDPRSPEELKSLRMMVANALGITAAGTPGGIDQAITIQEVAFQAPAIEKPQGMNSEGMMETARPWITPVVAVLIVLIFLRQLKRTPPDEIPLELLNPRGASNNAGALEGNMAAAKLVRDKEKERRAVSPEMLNDMIRQKPENVSAALREWMVTKN